jgi:hypothetical protein
MWDAMRKWLDAGGALPRDCSSLLSDLAAPTYSMGNAAGKFELEPKDKIKAGSDVPPTSATPGAHFRDAGGAAVARVAARLIASARQTDYDPWRAYDQHPAKIEAVACRSRDDTTARLGSDLDPMTLRQIADDLQAGARLGRHSAYRDAGVGYRRALMRGVRSRPQAAGAACRRSLVDRGGRDGGDVPDRASAADPGAHHGGAGERARGDQARGDCAVARDGVATQTSLLTGAAWRLICLCAESDATRIATRRIDATRDDAPRPETKRDAPMPKTFTEGPFSYDVRRLVEQGLEIEENSMWTYAAMSEHVGSEMHGSHPALQEALRRLSRDHGREFSTSAGRLCRLDDEGSSRRRRMTGRAWHAKSSDLRRSHPTFETGNRWPTITSARPTRTVLCSGLCGRS